MRREVPCLPWPVLLCLSLLTACGPVAGPPAATPSVDARAASELARADDRGNICSAREAKAAGLRAEYFASPDFKGEPVLVRMEGPVDEPLPAKVRGVSEGVLSARWRGWIRPPISGRYAFHAEVSGATIRVSGQLLASGRNEGVDAPATVELAAGRFHPITVEVRRIRDADRVAGGDVRLRLSWTAPHGARYLVPKAVLFPPSETVADGVGATAPRTP